MFANRINTASSYHLNEYTNPPREGNVPASSNLVNILSKKNYVNFVKEKRKEFIHSYFQNELISLFKELENDAKTMKNCNKQWEFEVPEPFDRHKIENMLKGYFEDLGYKTITEECKDKNTKIILTIT